MRIYEAELADDYGEESERNRLRKHDTYQSWREIADEVIATFDSVLSFFDPEGFRFHLPAYMTWTVRFSETWDSNTADSTLFAVTRVPPAAELDSWQSERFGRFDAPQRRAIAAFLRYMAAHHDDQDARAAIGFWEGLS